MAWYQCLDLFAILISIALLGSLFGILIVGGALHKAKKHKANFWFEVFKGTGGLAQIATLLITTSFIIEWIMGPGGIISGDFSNILAVLIGLFVNRDFYIEILTGKSPNYQPYLGPRFQKDFVDFIDYCLAIAYVFGGIYYFIATSGICQLL